MSAAALSPAFAVRPEQPGDRNYIRDTWRKCERHAAIRAGRMFDQAAQSATMEVVLGRASTRVRIAYPYGSAETIAAWAVVRPPVRVIHKGTAPLPPIGPMPIVYYVYTRDDGRRIGLADLLLADIGRSRRCLVPQPPPFPLRRQYPHISVSPGALLIEP